MAEFRKATESPDEAVCCLITTDHIQFYSHWMCITLSPNGRFKLWRAWMVSGLRSVCHMITASFVNVFWLFYVLSFGNTPLLLHSISKQLHFNCNVGKSYQNDPVSVLQQTFLKANISFTTSSKCSDAPFFSESPPALFSLQFGSIPKAHHHKPMSDGKKKNKIKI